MKKKNTDSNLPKIPQKCPVCNQNSSLMKWDANRKQYVCPKCLSLKEEKNERI